MKGSIPLQKGEVGARKSSGVLWDDQWEHDYGLVGMICISSISGKLFSTSEYLVSPGSSFIQYHACLTVFFLSTSFSICLGEHAGVKLLSALSHSLNYLNFLY